MQVVIDPPKGWAAAHRGRTRPLVYDCFPFFQELDILEIRLAELYDVVDFFILGEARETFQGASKPLYFQENRARFAPYLDKICTVTVAGSDDPGPYRARRYDATKSRRSPAWTRQGAQRNALIAGLADARPDDWVLLSDLDEIPRGRVVGRVAQDPVFRRGVHIFENDYFKYALDRRRVGEPWCGARMLERRAVRTMQDVRMLRHEPHQKSIAPWLTWRSRTMLETRALVFPQRIPDAGWHLTWIGEIESNLYKARSLSGGKGADLTDEELRARFRRIYTGERDEAGEEYEIAPLADLPKAVREHPERYAHLMSEALMREAVG
ncbi:MAG: hypothetical protein AAFW46_01015 [Pseudomonadota bacterium]